jgi:hypothetical protein
MADLPTTTVSVLQSSEEILSTLHHALEVSSSFASPLSCPLSSMLLNSDSRAQSFRNNEPLSKKPTVGHPSSLVSSMSVETPEGCGGIVKRSSTSSCEASPPIRLQT